jgi:hypothetical protein
MIFGILLTSLVGRSSFAASQRYVKLMNKAPNQIGLVLYYITWSLLGLKVRDVNII